MIDRLMVEIAACLHEGGDWCSLEKAHSLACCVVALRPRVVVEIGVWMGGSLVPMLLALRTLDEMDRAAGRVPVVRQAVAIDPWSSEASCAGQIPENADWWSRADHEVARRAFLRRLDKHGLFPLCDVVQARSDDATVPEAIDLLHVDGNHAEQAERDVRRFAPSVTPGGILVLDDLTWTGDHVRRARDHALELGFRELHELGSGVVMQRVRGEPKT